MIAASDNDEDWESLASALGVKKATAYSWIKNGNVKQKPRGGQMSSKKKLTDERVEFLIDKLNDNPLLTLKQMTDELFREYGIHVSVHTVARQLNGRLISLKCVHKQPEGANTLVNKTLRKEYVEKVMMVNDSFFLALAWSILQI